MDQAAAGLRAEHRRSQGRGGRADLLQQVPHPDRHGHFGRCRPAAAGTLSRPRRLPARRARHEEDPDRRAEPVLPEHPPERVGRHAARHRGLLPRRHPGGPRPGRPPSRRVRHDPDRGTRQPGPLAQPGRPADHPHLDPLRPADLQRPGPRPGLPAPRRPGRPLPPLLQHQDAARGRSPHRRRTRSSHPRSAAPGTGPVAGRDDLPVPPGTRQRLGKPPAGRRHLPADARPLAPDLRNPRRTRPAGAPDAPPMASHLRLPAASTETFPKKWSGSCWTTIHTK